jgi:hypothetical protein
VGDELEELGLQLCVMGGGALARARTKALLVEIKGAADGADRVRCEQVKDGAQRALGSRPIRGRDDEIRSAEKIRLQASP